MRSLNFIRISVCLMAVAAAMGESARAQGTPARLRFELSFPANMRSEPVDGRVFVVVTRKETPEPRLQFGKTGGQYASQPFFGENVENFAPGSAAVVDGRSEGYPLARLAELPAGDYYVQGVLNVYTTFHRDDGHV